MKDEILGAVGRYAFQAEPFHCDNSYHLFLPHLCNQLLNAADLHSNRVSIWKSLLCQRFMRGLR